MDWEAFAWSLAFGLCLTLLFALPPLLAFLVLGWPAAVAAAVAAGAAVALLVKGKWGELAGYILLALLYGGLAASIYQLLDCIPPPAAALAALSAPLLCSTAIAYQYAVGNIPPMYSRASAGDTPVMTLSYEPRKNNG